MKNFKKTAACIFVFCLTFIITGCTGAMHQAEAKTKAVRKGITYDTELEEIYMDISKLTPKEGEAALNKLSTGKYGDKLLVVCVKAKSAANAEKKYIKWGKEFQQLASNKYRLLPFSGEIGIRKSYQKEYKGYYECFDTELSSVYTYYYLEQYIDNIFDFQDAEKDIYGSRPVSYFENFTFEYTDPAGEKHEKKINLDYLNFSIKSVYSEILSREQFAQASDAVRIAFLLFPRNHFTTYAIWRTSSDWDMKALAEQRWTGNCEAYSILTHQLAAYLSFDMKCRLVFMDTPGHAIAFVRAKNSDGEWEFFETDNEDTYFDYYRSIIYSQAEEQSKYDAFLTEAIQYMCSSSVPELTEMATAYSIKKGLEEGCLNTTMDQMLASLADKWWLSPDGTIEYAFINQNDEKYGCPAITGTCLVKERL